MSKPPTQALEHRPNKTPTKSAAGFSRKAKPASPRHVGATAIGSAGRWSVTIDETLGGPLRWFAQIEGPFACVYIELVSLNIVKDIRDLLSWCGGDATDLRGRGLAGAALQIGTFGRARVDLVRDDEVKDRCFLLIGPVGKTVVRLTFGKDDLKMLSAAVEQACEDLVSEGLLPT